MPWDRFVLGYHGCDQSIVTDILTGKASLHASRNDYDWLGHGIYFWEDSYQRAFQWAQQSRRIKHPAVIGAVINLGHCLNLLDVEHLNTVRIAYQTLEKTAAQAETPLPANRGRTFKDRKLDCAVIETLHQMRKEEALEPYQTVRGFFVEGEALYQGAGLRHQDHIQLCVRDTACIVGFFLPRVK
jgi:hypothetical protein